MITMAELQALWDARREQALREYNENLNDRVSHDWADHDPWRLAPDHVFGSPWNEGQALVDDIGPRAFPRRPDGLYS